MRRRTATCIVLSLLASPRLAAPVYRATEVQAIDGARRVGLSDINNRNEAVGYSGHADIVWNPASGSRTYRQPHAVDDGLYLLFINDSGATAGIVDVDDDTRREPVFITPHHEPIRFTQGTWAHDTLDRSFPLRDLSNGGQVLGVSASPWLWSADAGLRPIGDYVDAREYLVNRVNSHGQVVGMRTIDRDEECFAERAFVYDDATRQFQALDTGPPDITQDFCGGISEANAINDLGQVVGDGELPTGHAGSVPYLWSREAGFTPLVSADPAMTDFVPLDINNRGQVVGAFQYKQGSIRQPWRFFYWDAASGIVDIQGLLDPADPLSAQIQFRANAAQIQITDAGVISLPGQVPGHGIGHWYVLFPQ